MARASVLPGYSFSTSASRYRSTATGQFVSRQRILDLLDGQITSAENRIGALTTSFVEGQLAPAMYQVQMRDELRRLHIQNASLGAGGLDKPSQREYGRMGAMLRDDYRRITNLITDVQAGKATLPQALNRVQGYIGSARVNFYAAERDAAAEGARQRGVSLEERRRLGVAEHCGDCVSFAALGWQPLGVLYPPGVGSSCTSHCRCLLERREVSAVTKAA